MSENKKPDNVVFNPETNKYDAALKPYATSLNAPVITTTDMSAWKNRNINKVNHKIKATYLDLKNRYEKMIEEFEYSSRIFNAKFSFEPIIGQTYHLYKNKKGEDFLSIIAPDQCNFEVVGSFYLNENQFWEKV